MSEAITRGSLTKLDKVLASIALLLAVTIGVLWADFPMAANAGSYTVVRNVASVSVKAVAPSGFTIYISPGTSASGVASIVVPAGKCVVLSGTVTRGTYCSTRGVSVRTDGSFVLIERVYNRG